MERCICMQYNGMILNRYGIHYIYISRRPHRRKAFESITTQLHAHTRRRIIK
jgi:hypothetical protein